MPRTLIAVLATAVALTACGGGDKPQQLDLAAYEAAGIDHTTINYWYTRTDDQRAEICDLLEQIGPADMRATLLAAFNDEGLPADEDPATVAASTVRLYEMSC